MNYHCRLINLSYKRRMFFVNRLCRILYMYQKKQQFNTHCVAGSFGGCLIFAIMAVGEDMPLVTCHLTVIALIYDPSIQINNTQSFGTANITHYTVHLKVKNSVYSFNLN